MSFNQATFIGNLGQDATRNKVGDQTVCNFSIAVNKKTKDKEETLWIRCALWGKRAESGVVDYLTKGKQVLVMGPVDIEEYTTKDGEVRRNLRVNVNEISLLGGGDGKTRQESKPKADPTEENPFAR
jgi:single-strand DNA-binding protein